MKSVFVDISRFYAFLHRDYRFHAVAKRLFIQAVSEGWMLLTSNYVIHPLSGKGSPLFDDVVVR